jgi:TBC1 domain family member 14
MAIDGSSDDETTIAPQRAKKHPKNASFDLDDAFSDGDDDHDPDFVLSSAAIREELARNQSLQEAENGVDAEVEDTTPASNGRSEGGAMDNSVSTIDIGGPALGFPPSPAGSSLHRTPEESEYSNDFSQVSLSEHTPPDHDDKLNTEESDIPYPMVHIDASKSPSSRVELAHSSVPSDAQIDSPSQDSPSQDQDPRDLQPPHSAPASSSQHDIPPAILSVPKVPIPRRLTTGHRPTRSVGPSALEKVVSKTRPAYLPPKTKLEDNKHMADWERMMKQSRAAGESFYFPVIFCDL